MSSAKDEVFRRLAALSHIMDQEGIPPYSFKTMEEAFCAGYSRGLSAAPRVLKECLLALADLENELSGPVSDDQQTGEL